MQVKKFEAPTIQEALDAIKRELGPDAIILQTKKNKKGFGLLNGASVEVTAAISDRAFQKKRISDRSAEAAKVAGTDRPRNSNQGLAQGYPEQMKTLASLQAHDKPSVRSQVGMQVRNQITRYANLTDDETEVSESKSFNAHDAHSDAAENQRVVMQREASVPAQSSMDRRLEQEVAHLKRMLEELKQDSRKNSDSNPDIGSVSLFKDSEALREMFDRLILANIERKFAYQILKKVAFELDEMKRKDSDHVLEQTLFEMMNELKVSQPNPKVQAVAVIGPTGVGKTTSLAKLASYYSVVLRKRVGIVNLDTFRVGASEQLQTYAKILGLPYRNARSAHEFSEAMHDFEKLDVVLIDTTGRSQKDEESIREIKAVLEESPRKIETQVVIGANLRDSDGYDILKRYSLLNPTGLIMTKLDESSVYGSMYNYSHRFQIPLSYFSTGQCVPEDLEEATKERVLSLIMDL